VGVSRAAQIMSVPLLDLSQERVKLRTSSWQVHSHGPSEQKPIKNFGERERVRIQGLPNFFEYPLLSQKWVKLRTSSNFVRTFI